MSTYRWSLLSDADIIAFDPAVDVLRVDESNVSASQIFLFEFFDDFGFFVGIVF